MPYKRECQDEYFPCGSMPVHFCLGIQPNCLNVHSYSESGLGQEKVWFLCVRETEKVFFFAVVPFRCCDGAIVSETTSRAIVHSVSGNAWSYRRL